MRAERIDLICLRLFSRFDVFLGAPLAPEYRLPLEHLARCRFYSQVSLERIWHDPWSARETRLHLSGEKHSVVELEVLDFIASLVPKSVKKKMKDKAFAAKVDREIIRQGVELLGVEMAEHVQFMIDALKPHAEELGLTGTGK